MYTTVVGENKYTIVQGVDMRGMRQTAPPSSPPPPPLYLKHRHIPLGRGGIHGGIYGAAQGGENDLHR